LTDYLAVYEYADDQLQLKVRSSVEMVCMCSVTGDAAPMLAVDAFVLMNKFARPAGHTHFQYTQDCMHGLA